ncbi:MAG: hypothetical protein IJB69_02420 [Clostridia bacterium]|nr:hypothetical protein [Clostridia bacterium]
MVQKAMGTTLSCLHNEETVLIGALRSVSEIRAEAEAVDVTPLDAKEGFRTYAQGVKTLGEVTLEGFHDKAQPGQEKLRSLFDSGDEALFCVTFPDATALSFRAFVKSYAFSNVEVEGVVHFTAVLRLCGPVEVA